MNQPFFLGLKSMLGGLDLPVAGLQTLYSVLHIVRLRVQERLVFCMHQVAMCGEVKGLYIEPKEGSIRVILRCEGVGIHSQLNDRKGVSPVSVLHLSQ